MKEYLVEVDQWDNEIGSIEKMEAHRTEVLHRAFSIFIFNSNNELLLQKRNLEKYHSPGLWTNTCCSHPRFGEDLQKAIYRRLDEEMGFTCDLKEAFSFIYQVKLQDNLFEHEFDHVFIGKFHGKVSPAQDEVEDYKWAQIGDIKIDISNNPQNYTYWFKHILQRVESYMEDLGSKTQDVRRKT